MGIETALGVGKVLAPSLIGGLLGGKGSSQSGTQTQTQTNQLSPEMQKLLYGENGQGGLINRYAGMLDTPQSAGLQAAGNAADAYLGSQSNNLIDQITSGANRLMQGQTAAQSGGVSAPLAANYQAAKVGSPVMAQAAQGNMPSQNNIDLGSAYNQYIYGNAAENPYLTGAIQAGINQGMKSFGNLQEDATRNLTESILPNIRGGAIASGQYGGSRQGISESKAVKDFSTQMTRALENVGKGSIDSAIATQSGAFDAGQNRGLSALGSLGSQQYGSASQNVGNQQQANLFNAGNANQFLSQNQQAQNQANQFNRGAVNQNNQYFAGLGQNNQQFNANAQNQQNQLNNQALLSGMGALQNLYNTQYGLAQNANNYELNRAQAVNSMIAPYTNTNSTSTNSTPLYQNKGANFLGGALMGNQIGGALGGLFGGSNTSNPTSFLNAFGSGY